MLRQEWHQQQHQQQYRPCNDGDNYVVMLCQQTSHHHNDHIDHYQ